MNREEFWYAVEWEGGLFETLFGYGLSSENIEDEDIKRLVSELEVWYSYMEPIINKLEETNVSDF